MGKLEFITKEVTVPIATEKIPAKTMPTAVKPIYTSREHYLLGRLKQVCLEYLKCKTKTPLFSSLCVSRLVALGYLKYSDGYIICFNRIHSITTRMDFVSLKDQDACFISENRVDVKSVKKLIEETLRTRLPYPSLKKYPMEFLDSVPEMVLGIIKDLGIVKL